MYMILFSFNAIITIYYKFSNYWPYFFKFKKLVELWFLKLQLIKKNTFAYVHNYGTFHDN